MSECKAEKTKEIPSELTALGEAIGGLYRRVSDLEEKLATVLHPSDPVATGPQGTGRQSPDDPGNCDLGYEIACSRQRVDGIAILVLQISERLEL